MTSDFLWLSYDPSQNQMSMEQVWNQHDTMRHSAVTSWSVCSHSNSLYMLQSYDHAPMGSVTPLGHQQQQHGNNSQSISCFFQEWPRPLSQQLPSLPTPHPHPPPPSVFITDIQSAGGLQVWLKTSSWNLTQHIYGRGGGNFKRFYLKTKCETCHQENVSSLMCAGT